MKGSTKCYLIFLFVGLLCEGNFFKNKYLWHAAISVDVAGSKLQAYVTRLQYDVGFSEVKFSKITNALTILNIVFYSLHLTPITANLRRN